jgi:hypothetical protein
MTGSIKLCLGAVIGSSITFGYLRKWREQDNATRNERWELKDGRPLPLIEGKGRNDKEKAIGVGAQEG